MFKLLFFLTIISISVAVGIFIGRYPIFSGVKADSSLPETSKLTDFFKKATDAQIENFQSWEDDKGNKFFGIVQQLKEPCDKDFDISSCQKFSIYDEKGKAVYEFKDFLIEDIQLKRLTANSLQLILTTNGGGTDSFLEIVGYKTGQFTKIIDSDKTQMRGGYWTMPEYRSGVKTPYFKPSQLFVIGQTGGADDNPPAEVFRYKNNKYQSVGAISMRELGDSIEKQLAKSK